MKATKHIVLAERALQNSATVSALEVSAALLWAALQSPGAEVFLDATIMVVKPGGSNNYADLYRILGNGTGAGISGISVKQIFHWDIPIADNTYGGYVTAVTMDVDSGNIRVRVTGDPSASEAMATCWLKAWANG